MAVCIECSTQATPGAQSKLYCRSCHKKMDKYYEVNNTLKIIDLILLKEPIFRHFLFNSAHSNWNIAMLIFFYFCALCSIRISDLQISTLKIRTDKLIEINLFYTSIITQLTTTFIYVACLRLAFSKISFRSFIHALLVGSFYSGFKIVFSVWNYNVVHYFIIIDILSACGNMFALYCLESDFTKVSSSILMAKILSVVLSLNIAHYFTS
ncbi:lipid intermediate transporter [Pancytospora epiphaga]|nr:lipid intermediate transporter [Pancytospora epiphaga]